MRSIFIINTPADVHTWKNLIHRMNISDNQVIILARNYGCTKWLLDKYGFKYKSFQPIKSKYMKFLEVFSHAFYCVKAAHEFHPDAIFGFGVDAAFSAAILRKPCIVFTDTEPLPLQHFLTKIFATMIVTPSCFLRNLGDKQVRISSFKELAYLHPDYFQPDPSIYDELGINKENKFVILRFNAFDAFHDTNRKGFSRSDKHKLVQELGKHAKVFISAEGTIPPELQDYKVQIPYERIHHAIYYSQLLVCDTGTMATEAAVLGTPAVVCLSNAHEFGNFIELEQKYGLIYCFQEPEGAIRMALDLIQREDLKKAWLEKRSELYKTKVNATKAIIDLIEKRFSVILNDKEPISKQLNSGIVSRT